MLKQSKDGFLAHFIGKREARKGLKDTPYTKYTKYITKVVQKK